MYEFGHYYPEIDLTRVRYATDVNTIHGQAITFHYDIFFPSGDIDFNSDQDTKLMLHELEHTAQYERRGGEQAFVSEYILHAAGRIIETRSLNVHDAINTERDAIAKADQIMALGRMWSCRKATGCTVATIRSGSTRKNLKKARLYQEEVPPTTNLTPGVQPCRTMFRRLPRTPQFARQTGGHARWFS